MLRSWRGGVRARGGWLYLQVRDGAGRWRQRALHLEDTPANRERAEGELTRLRAQLRALEDAGAGPAPLTVRGWCERWLRDRHNADAGNDAARLRLHVYPVVGSVPLDELRPRHLVQVVDRLRAAGRAPRTVRNVYAVVKAALRDARVADVLQGPDPAILTHRQLGRVRDGPRFERATAVYSGAELAALLTDDRVPADRRVWYGLLGLGMLRTGEAAGLRWRCVQRAEPLGRLVVETSYDRGETKTGTTRWTPVHPFLARLLAEWRLGGWARTWGRPPTDDDLVCPVPEGAGKGPRRPAGAMRTRHYSRRRLARDLAALGLRLRRTHDLRRTGISLCQDGGASPEVLRWATHAPPRATIDGYTTLAWATLCRAVACNMMVGGAPPPRTQTDVDPG